MMQKFSLRNRLLLSIVSADFWSSIRILNEHGIPIKDIQLEDSLAGHILIQSKDFYNATALLEKHGDRVSPVAETGISVFLRKIRSRPILLCGVMLAVVSFLFLPTRIWQIEITGNHSISERQILSAGEEAGIHLLASRRAIRSEKAKNLLLSAIPELQWAGANTYGCKAVITVKERSPTQNATGTSNTISNISAIRDGVVLSATVQNGTLLCQEGQAVKKGQTLISGYTDCGICLRAGRSDGEVYAQTVHNFSVVTPDQAINRQVIRHEKHYSLILGKKRINLWKGSGISDTVCGRIYKDYYLKLPGGYKLPLVLSCETDIIYDNAQESFPSETLRPLMISYSKAYLSNQMIAGSIQNERYSVAKSAGLLSLRCEFRCTEMIGREHLEIGAPYE